MASSSGTYSFSASNASIVLSAFERLQIRLPSLRQEHFDTAKREFNFMLSQLSNLGPNLWEVELVSQALTQGTSTYAVNPKVIMVLDVYISLNQGQASQTDRFIEPMSRTEYASMPNKLGQGEVTSFWFDRVISPTVTFWPVPDNTETTCSYYRFTQIQDAATANAATPQILYLCLDAYVAGLAHRMARIYKPELETIRDTDAAKALNLMFTQLVENVPMYITPITQAYWA